MSAPNPYEPPTAGLAELTPAPRTLPGGYRSNARLVRALTWLLAANVLVAVVSIGSDFAELGLLGRMRTGDFTMDEANANDARVAALGLVDTGVYLVTAVVFAVFLYRNNKNVRALGAAAMKYTPGWTVGWFFVPLLSLYKPYRAVLEMWENSGDLQARGGGSGLLGAWWGAWLIMNISSQIMVRMSLHADGIDELERVGSADLFVQAVSVVAALLAMAVVRGLNERVERQAAAAQTAAG